LEFDVYGETEIQSGKMCLKIESDCHLLDLIVDFYRKFVGALLQRIDRNALKIT
jgi:hypothetical protein